LTAWAALVTAGVVAGLSAFFLFIGLPDSYATAAEQCSLPSNCIQTMQSGTNFVPTQWAALPLVLGCIIAFGVFKYRTAISWAALAGLGVFSFISLVSIGLLYFPFVIALVGLLASFRSQNLTQSGA
jgi:hypothetical protein